MIPYDIIVGTELLAVVLSAGGATMLAAIVQAYRSIKEGSRSDEQNLETGRRDALRERRNAEKMSDYWHSYAAQLLWVIATKLGPDHVPPAPPLPVLEKEDK